MLEEQVNEVIKNFKLGDKNAITFGHPKMKMKWVLPIPGMTVYSFEQFQPFFIYFDSTGISFFPLDLNNNYSVIGKSYIAWTEMKHLTFKKGMLLENTIEIELENGKIQMNIPKTKAMNPWVKENNQYLAANHYFYNELQVKE